MGLARSAGSVMGLFRSLLVYYAQPWRRRAQARFYADLLPQDGLAFDVGAHVGSRTRSLLRRCRHVVAVEPQPLFARWLARLFRNEPRVSLVNDALGATPGTARLQISRLHPTVSSLSGEWVAKVSGSRGFESVAWDESVEVDVTTLDALVATHGMPDFCKLDVEGLEADILSGVSQPLPLVAFEYLPAALDVANACIDRLEALGRYEYNLTNGESSEWLLDEWCDAAGARSWLAMIARGGSSESGDLYARLLNHHSAGNAPTSDTSP